MTSRLLNSSLTDKPYPDLASKVVVPFLIKLLVSFKHFLTSSSFDAALNDSVDNLIPPPDSEISL